MAGKRAQKNTLFCEAAADSLIRHGPVLRFVVRTMPKLLPERKKSWTLRPQQNTMSTDRSQIPKVWEWKGKTI